jgi:putative MATE family efflux protein
MKSKIISTPGIWRPLAYLAGPVLAEQLLALLVGLVDTWLTGHFVPGEAPMAAIGLMAYVMWLLPSLFASVAIGATAMVARFVGAGDVPLAGRITNQSFLCGVIFAAVITAAFGFFSRGFVEVMGLQGEAAALSLRYLRYLVPAIPAIMILQVGIACLRGAGDTVSGLLAMICVNAVNVVVGVALVTGAGGAPKLGWDGMAIGTCAGHIVGALVVLAILLAGRRGLQLRLDQLRPDLGLIRRLMRVGFPGGMDIAAVLGCHLWFVRMINGLGALPASAHMLAVRVESIAYLPGQAFQVAASTMAGQYLGAQDFHRAARSVRAACVSGLVFMCGAGLLFYFGGEMMTAFFTGSATNQTAMATVPLLKVAAFSMPGMAVAMIVAGALRGAGDTRWPLMITLIGFLLVRIPGAAWLLHEPRMIPGTEIVLPTGVLGAWVATLIDLWVRAALTLWRFWHGGWRNAKV